MVQRCCEQRTGTCSAFAVCMCWCHDGARTCRCNLQQVLGTCRWLAVGGRAVGGRRVLVGGDGIWVCAAGVGRRGAAARYTCPEVSAVTAVRHVGHVWGRSRTRLLFCCARARHAAGLCGLQAAVVRSAHLVHLWPCDVGGRLLHLSGGAWAVLRGTRRHVGPSDYGTRVQPCCAWVRGWPGWVPSRLVQHAGVG